jgi:hypothetical protein
MNEEIKNYITERCVKAGMEKPYDSYGGENYLLFFNEFVSVSVSQGNFEGVLFFEINNVELQNETIAKFILPEKLETFILICDALQIELFKSEK